MMNLVGKIPIILCFFLISCCSTTDLPDNNRGYYEDARSFMRSYTLPRARTNQEKSRLAKVDMESAADLESLIVMVRDVGFDFNKDNIRRRLDMIAKKHNFNPEPSEELHFLILGIRDIVGRKLE